MPDQVSGLLGMKRATDLILSIMLVLLLSWLLVLAALLVRINLGSPVLFRQQRPGLHGKPFELVKFRTMRDVRDDAGNPLPDEYRMTALGRILRRTSLISCRSYGTCSWGT